MASDLQDPPEMISQFIAAWEDGYSLVMAVKPVSEGNSLMHFLRRSYYRILDRISDAPITRDTTGFGLYDKKVVQELKKINDPYPYLRGLIDELGFSMQTIEFIQPRRIRGITKNNFYTLYDIAMLGLVSHSMIPIRLASILGMVVGFVSMILAFLILLAKLIWWDTFAAGYAPILITVLFMLGLIMLFVGLLGEYVGVILTHVRNRPVVTERERVNFD